MSTINLQDVLFARLSECCERVYFENIPEKDPVTQKKPIFPLVIYYIADVEPYSTWGTWFIEVEVQDENSDSTSLEILTDQIASKLDRYRHLETGKSSIFARLKSRDYQYDAQLCVRKRFLLFEVTKYF